jgi:3D (Asp-Asp-Asp) domain-containing protein
MKLLAKYELERSTHNGNAPGCLVPDTANGRYHHGMISPDPNCEHFAGLSPRPDERTDRLTGGEFDGRDRVGRLTILMRLPAIWILIIGIAASIGHPAQARRHHPAHSAVNVGIASSYGTRATGRHMADGRRFRANGLAVASRTLPLGSRVRVTDLDTGRSVVAEVEDRGPYVRGRILDVSPGVARRLGMNHGLARVRIERLS